MISEIGRKIRDLRSAAQLTQEELAERADLTDGFISQIERGRTSISIDSLKQILDALNVSLADFFRDVEPLRIVFSRRDWVTLEDENCRLVLLVPGATNRAMEPVLLELPAGSSTEQRPPFQGDSFGYILKGRVQISYGSEIYRARIGECFYFTADREYRIDNPYNRDALILWLTSPPNF
ncbi:MAG: helix-turn-helix domain-containing protein [Calditrichaeota bacterium]|nr:helix-turn-helix domain-containing protein [Calditrichota bacterium]